MKVCPRALPEKSDFSPEEQMPPHNPQHGYAWVVGYGLEKKENIV